MLSYSVINVKLLQNIVFKLSDKRNCLLFFFFLLERAGRSSMTSALRKLSAAGSACLCVFSEQRAGQRVGFFPPCWNNFLRGKLLFMSAATRRTVGLFVTCGSKSKSLCWPLAALQCILIWEVISHLLFKSRIVVDKSRSQVRGKECFLWRGNAEFFFLFQLKMPVFFHWVDTYLLKQLWNSLFGS